jgi:hypothetical protein
MILPFPLTVAMKLRLYGNSQVPVTIFTNEDIYAVYYRHVLGDWTAANVFEELTIQ